MLWWALQFLTKDQQGRYSLTPEGAAFLVSTTSGRWVLPAFLLGSIWRRNVFSCHSINPDMAYPATEPPDRAEILIEECISGRLNDSEFRAIVSTFSIYELDHLSELLIEESNRFAHLEQLSQTTSARLVAARIASRRAQTRNAGF